MSRFTEKARKAEIYLRNFLGNTAHRWFSRENKGPPFGVVVASAHKVGSTWLVKMLDNLYIYRWSTVPMEIRQNPVNKHLLRLQMCKAG